MRNANHFPLKASTEFQLLLDSTEKCLSTLQFEFLQHKTRDVAEFEIVKPHYFRVVLERRKDPEVSNFILPSIKAAKGTCVDIWLDTDQAQEVKLEAFENAREFLKSLVASLPVEPWIGLRFRESGREKKRWVQIMAI